MKENFWHLSLFAARLVLLAFIVGYLYLMGGVAPGGLGLGSIMLMVAAYAGGTLAVCVISKGQQLSPAMRRTQTVLDNLALAIGVPHDPSMAMPVAFYLAVNPLEFGVRYGVESYRYAVLSALFATCAIVLTRSFVIDTGMDVEAAGLVLFTWSAILYGLITVHGMERLRGTVEELYQRHESAMQAVNFATWIWDLNADAEAINPRIDPLLGLAPGTYDGKIASFISLMHPEDRARAAEGLERSAAAKKGFEIRFRRVLDDGSIRWLATRGEPQGKNADGEITRMAGVIWNVTAEMQARERADKTLERVEAAVQIGGISFWEIDVRGQTIEYDSSGARAQGLARKPIPLALFIEQVHPEDRAGIQGRITTTIDSGEVATFSFRWFQQRKNRYIHLHTFSNVIRDAYGAVTGLTGVAVDETERVLAQQQAEFALTRVDSAAAASHIGFWRMDAATGTLELDHNWRKVLGYDAEARLPDFEQSLAWVHPEDRELFVQKINHALEHDEPLLHEYRVHRADTGELRHFQIRGDAVRHPNGDVLTHAGFLMDQTEMVNLRAKALRATTLLENSLAVVPAVAFRMPPGSSTIELAGNTQALIGVVAKKNKLPLTTVTQYIVEEDRQTLVAALKQAFKQRGPLDHTFRANHAQTGETLWQTVRGRVVTDADGDVSALIGVIVDDTQSEKQRQAMEALRERYDLGMRAAGVGGWTWFAKENKFEAEPLLYDLFRLDPSTSSSLGAWMSGVHPDDRDAVKAVLSTGHIAGEGFEIRYRRLQQTDEAPSEIQENGLWTMTRGEPLEIGDDGRALRMAGATWDITELATLTEALERSNRELDDFAHIASHDLREPLRGLHNYSKFLNEDYADKLDDEGQRMLSALSRLSQRLESLISDLLEFSRVGRTELAIEATDLNTVAEDVLDTLEYSIDDKSIDIRIPNPLPTVKCDRVRVGELYRNLITNAIKYNDKQNKWIELGHDNGVFYVRDNGIGIPTEHHERVFSIFKRLHTRDAYGGGTGAGLTIVKRIVERHDGEIWLESTHGEGTTFYFTLAQSGS